MGPIYSVIYKLKLQNEEVDLTWNSRVKKNIITLSKALQKSNNIKLLILNSCGLDNKDFVHIADAININSSLVIFALGWNQLKQDTKYFSKSLKFNTNLKIIFLWKNCICDEGLKYLSDSLMHN